MPSIKIKVVPINQNSNTFYLGKIKAKDIKSVATVDRFDPGLPVDHLDQGYQRAADATRYKKFANYLLNEKNALSPTAILLSARNIDLKYDSTSSEISLSPDKKLQIVDGQHRVEGYRYAIFEKNAYELANFEIPVIIVPGMDKVTEMKQFRTINGTQKSVRLDLVNMILTQISKQLGEENIKEKELRNVVVTRVVENLNINPNSPWKNLIVMPNDRAYSKKEIQENPNLANEKIVRATSFLTSIKPIYAYLSEHEFINGDSIKQSEEMSTILINFWSAVKSLVPDAFKKPADSVIQKTPGLFSLHHICRRLLPRLHKAGRGWGKADFERVLERSDSLTNPEFWDADNGEAAKYGSMKGFAELAEKIDDELVS